VWLGLVLTTPSAPWPNGLPFAQAGPGFIDGWRWMYVVGALLAVIAILLRVRLPESPRWLVGKGRLAEADAVVSDMERMASRHGPLAAPSEDVPVDSPSSDGHTPYATLLGNRVYLLRVLLLLSVWFLAYITVFSFAAGFTSLLTALKYPPPAAGVIVAVGAFGFLACALFAAAFAERLERKLWLPIGALITIIGGVIVAEAGKEPNVVHARVAAEADLDRVLVDEIALDPFAAPAHGRIMTDQWGGGPNQNIVLFRPPPDSFMLL